MDALQTITAAAFWCSAGGVAYAWLGYPVVIYACSRVFGNAPMAPETVGGTFPRVALLIAAHNEAEVIEQRIHSALQLHYPAGRLEIVVASDGSDDATNEICRRYAGRVHLFDFPVRRGKSATLNEAVEQIDAEIIVFSDANTSMHEAALMRLARWFADPGVGAVCGRLVLVDPQTGRNVDSVYWRYETFLKQCEGRLNALLGANGAIYALRRKLFSPLPAETLVDDFVIPLRARIQTGCRIVYDTEALAFEESTPDISGEYRRRARIGTGGFQAIGLLWPLLGPRHGWTAFAFWSHKILRWACPLFMIVALLACIGLARQALYRDMLFVQAGFYALCALGTLPRNANPPARLLRLFTMFASMNFALLVGLFRWIGKTQTGIWIRTQRQ